MISRIIQPWGKSPTPIVPSSVIEKIGHIDAPQEIKAILGEGARFSDINNIWEKVDNVSNECLVEIIDTINSHRKKIRDCKIHSSDFSSENLNDLPLTARSKNVVFSNLTQILSPSLTLGDLIDMRRMGLKSAIETASVIEEVAVNINLSRQINSLSNTSKNENNTFLSQVTLFFIALSSWAAGEKKFQTLVDALPVEIDEWPNEIKLLWSEIGKANTYALAGENAKAYSIKELIRQIYILMDVRQRNIALDRIFPVKADSTLEEIGSKFNITRERVRQIEKITLRSLNQLDHKSFLPLKRTAHSLKHKLGSAIPKEILEIDQILNEITDSFENLSEKQFAKGILLWLAGPYQQFDDWIIAKKEIQTLTLTSLREAQCQQGFIQFDRVTNILNSYGIKQDYHERWLKKLGCFLNVEEGVIEFDGNILEKSKKLLKYFNRPLTAEEMIEYIGSDSVRSLRQRLIDDPNFWRINKQNEFVLAGTDGYDEYTGITDEIIQELELCGGWASADHLIRKLSSVYGVKENSIVAYLNTPMFIKDENGVVRVRDEDEYINTYTDITKTAACYLSEEGIWRWRFKIDKDALRGSGRLIPNAFAQHLGCDIGDKIELPTEFGNTKLSWPLASTTGASIGSLRSVLDHFVAELEDYLFVEATKPSITFKLLKYSQVDSEDSNLVKLAYLLGFTSCDTEEDAIPSIASALSIGTKTQEAILIEARQKLDSRGETDLAELIEQPKLSVDDYINDMSRFLNRKT